MILLIEITSTIFFLIGICLYTGRKAENPLRRIQGFIGCMIGGILFIIWCFIVGAYFYAVLQVIVEILDLRGINNCWKEHILWKKHFGEKTE